MRLIDADKLPWSWQKGCNGGKVFVDSIDLDNATTVCCKNCKCLDRHWDGTIGRKPTLVCGRAGQPRMGRITDDSFGCSLFKESDDG